ncbi:MAG: ArsA family ATPase, partial [Vicinamibacterales bacterium]
MPRSKATSTPDRRTHLQNPRYRFIGGKGGVGKTTCAAAMGIVSARRGRRTLIISTDPAPSLGDALGQRLGRKPRGVRAVRRLEAVEVDASAALERWVAARRSTLESIALRGTWLDRDDVSRLLRLSLPGIDEIAGLLEIADLGSNPRYDQVIVDTAPTGHLLRMLGMPAVLEKVAEVFDHMQAKHRVIVHALRGRWTPDAADALIEQIDRQARETSALLRDPSRAAVSWVTLPEPMSVEETADAIGWLREQGMFVDAVVVNRLTTPPPQACRWCSARRRVERQAIPDLGRARALRGIPILQVPASSREPRGIAALAALGGRLERPRRAVARGRPAAPARVAAHLTLAGSSPVEGVTGLIAPAEARLVMFGGKGGVGKTTCATAMALAIATASPDRRVLLLSTDPAHSVGDALGQELSDAARHLHGGPVN